MAENSVEKTDVQVGKQLPRCPNCLCRNRHFKIGAGEVWVFEWCRHEVGVAEPVRLLAEILNAHSRAETIHA
jgi:hypothetical protein